jgi:hypothetical protein
MSPSRGRGQYVPLRPRSEVYTAIAVAAAIVIGTALLIWLMRPGAPGQTGTGGLFARQPRLTLLGFVTLLAIGGVVYYVLSRRRQWRFGRRVTVAIGVGIVIVLAVVVGIVWPGGVVKHYTSFSNAPVVPETTPSTTHTTTTTPATSPSTAAPPTTTKAP